MLEIVRKVIRLKQRVFKTFSSFYYRICFAQKKRVIYESSAPNGLPKSDDAMLSLNHSDKVLVIQIRYGGLGDHLLYSHLPRIAKQTGKYEKVCVSKHSVFRNETHKRYIWEMNPYVDGFCKEESEEQIIIAPDNRDTNILDQIMLATGLDDGLRWHEPELYYTPSVIKELENAVIFDPNYISIGGDGLSSAKITRFFTERVETIDYQFSLRNRSIPTMNFDAFLEDTSFEQFCSYLVSCKRLYCLTSGTATLAAALKKEATVLYWSGVKDSFLHSKLHSYVLID